MEQGESSQSKGKENPLRKFQIVKISSDHNGKEMIKSLIWQGSASDQSTIPLSTIDMPATNYDAEDIGAPYYEGDKKFSYVLEEKMDGRWIQIESLSPNKHMDVHGTAEDAKGAYDQ